MRQSDRAAGLDLSAKKRDYRATRPKHIAKPHDRKPSTIIPISIRLYHLLRRALCRPHDISGSDSLVSANENKVADRSLVGRPYDLFCTKNVVPNPFNRISLDQGHMLIRRSVINCLRPPSTKNKLQPRSVGHGSQDGYDFNLIKSLLAANN